MRGGHFLKTCKLMKVRGGHPFRLMQIPASDPHDFIAVASVGGVGLVSVDIPKSFLVF